MDKPQFDEIIEEPFLTEEGFVNPAALNALETVINNMPPDHERLASNPEWSTPRGMFWYWITAAVAKYAVIQSPYHLPEGLMAVVGYLDACLRCDIKADRDGYCQMSLCQVSKYLYDNLMELPQFRAWNEPKKGKAQMMFVSAYDGPRDPDCDFIDLYALIQNVCIEIRNEWRAADRFNAEFEAKHGKEVP